MACASKKKKNIMKIQRIIIIVKFKNIIYNATWKKYANRNGNEKLMIALHNVLVFSPPKGIYYQFSLKYTYCKKYTTKYVMKNTSKYGTDVRNYNNTELPRKKVYTIM